MSHHPFTEKQTRDLAHYLTVRPEALRRLSRMHRQNHIALMLAALDLMTIQQIRFCANGAGVNLPDTDDRKVLIEQIRCQLMG